MRLHRNLSKAVCCAVNFYDGVKCKLWHRAFTFYARNTAWAVAPRSNWSKEGKVSMLFGLESTSCCLMVGTLHWSCWHLQGGWSCFRFFRIIFCECWWFCIWSSSKILATRSEKGTLSQIYYLYFLLLSVCSDCSHLSKNSIHKHVHFCNTVLCQIQLFCWWWDFGGLKSFMANIVMSNY